MKRILICLLLIQMLFCSCNSKTDGIPLNQPRENVFKIELMEYRSGNLVQICAIDEGEVDDFWKKIKELKFYRYFNDPPTNYGPYAIKIQYKDGNVDIIGTKINGYFDKEGKGLQAGWYCVEDEEAFLKLFTEYAGR